MIKGAAIKFFQHIHLPISTFFMQLAGKPSSLIKSQRYVKRFTLQNGNNLA